MALALSVILCPGVTGFTDVSSMKSAAVDFSSSIRCCTRFSSRAIFWVMAVRVAAIVC
jgi:hypothetical protein